MSSWWLSNCWVNEDINGKVNDLVIAESINDWVMHTLNGGINDLVMNAWMYECMIYTLKSVRKCQKCVRIDDWVIAE